MHQPGLHHRTSHSLRGRYLTLSAVIVGIFLAVSVAAYVHIGQATERNSRSLELTERLNTPLLQMRDALRRTTLAIHTQSDTPDPRRDRDIEETLVGILVTAASLHDQPELARQSWQASLVRLEQRLQDLQQHVGAFLKQRQDPNWVYPLMPVLTETLLASYQGFENNMSLAIEETDQDLEEAGQLDIYRELNRLRGQWRRMILAFRAMMIGFAGFSEGPVQTPDKQHIASLHEQIMLTLEQMIANPRALPYGLQTEESLTTMRDHASDWLANLDRVLAQRDSGVWREDIRYIAEELHPRLRLVEASMDELEGTLRDWSRQTTETVREAAGHINLALWAVSGLGMLLFAILYTILARSVLQPISQVSQALADYSGSDEPIEVPLSDSLEIRRLVEAFDHMRQQVRGREEALEFQAMHDVLTQLPNRGLLNDRLEQGLANLERTGGRLALLLMDLDRFKEINDTLGHQIGDQVLMQVGERLTRLLRTNDTVARLGGDEFALVLPGAGRREAVPLASRIADAINEPFEIAGQKLFVGVSIGIVSAPDEGLDRHTLIRRADTAMYAAKNAKRDYAFYDAEQDEELAQTLELAGQLRTAIETNEGLRLFYQPRMAPDCWMVSSAEALLRWQSDDGKLISPERLIEVAEHTNLINELTQWVLDQAVADCAAWTREGRDMAVAVNLSPRDLVDPMLARRVADTLTRHQLPSDKLILELTENAVLNNPERARLTLVELAEQGITLSIDDFGTGYSSMARLRTLPVQELKIDKSFVMGMRHNENDAVIVYSTIDLGHNLGLHVVAEGVEDVETLTLLRQRRCDLIQGYLISRPVPLDELLALIDPSGEVGNQNDLEPGHCAVGATHAAVSQATALSPAKRSPSR